MTGKQFPSHDVVTGNLFPRHDRAGIVTGNSFPVTMFPSHDIVAGKQFPSHEVFPSHDTRVRLCDIVTFCRKSGVLAGVVG